MTKILEQDLILPSLYIMSLQENGQIGTTELKNELRQLLKPSGENLEQLHNRTDDKFSQIVRNLVSHKTLQKLEYAEYSDGIFTLTDEGRLQLEDENNRTYIENFLEEDFEGSETLEIPTVDDETEDVVMGRPKDLIQEKPSSARSLNIEKTYFSVYELQRKFEKGRLILDPDFQRENVWSPFQKSELIESILMNIPLPYIYLTEDPLGRLIVVDGRQRLTSLFDFMSGGYRLSRKLKILQNIGGKKFADLDTFQQGTIEDYQLTTHIIKPPLSDRILIDIFDRVNRSGTTLNNQEIRNALYQGNSTKMLKELAESDFFKTATENSIKPGRMKDRYLVLRFLSFYLWRTKFADRPQWEKMDYKGDTEDFLPKYMSYINSMDEEELYQLKTAFYSAMGNAITIFGYNAFRLPNKKDNKKRPINMALFESLGYLLSHDVVIAKKNELIGEYEALLENPDFMQSFLSIDSTVKYRFEVMDRLLEKLEK